jgi:hypothetical protein
MVQSQIAKNYLRLAQYEPANPDATKWIERTNRAGKAFEWSWDKYGVMHRFTDEVCWYIGVGPNELEPRFALNVHNKAIEDMFSIYKSLSGDDQQPWKRRIDRGISALISTDYPLSIEKHSTTKNGHPWSYHRINISNGAGHVANDSYHSLNRRTTARVASVAEQLGYPSEAVNLLRNYVTLWTVDA